MSAPVVVGLDFGGTKVAAVIADIDGHPLAHTRVSAGAERGARHALDRGIATVHELLAGAAPGRPVAAVGAATFGIPSADGVDLAPAIDGWGKLSLSAELLAAFGDVPVLLETDVKAAARAELEWGALRGADPGLYLNLGTGIAAALVVGGRVVTGRHGAAGEIGYNLRSVADLDRAGDGRAPLEEAVSGQALARLASRAAGRRTEAAAVFRAAADGDAGSRELVSAFSSELSMHVVNLAIALDPERIAVGGGLVGAWPQWADQLRRALQSAVPYPPELVRAEFPNDAPLRGALALAVEAVRHQPVAAVSSERSP